MEQLWLTLPIKMAASALIVVTASLLVERSGPVVGALIATLPISAGPGSPCESIPTHAFGTSRFRCVRAGLRKAK